MPKETGKVDSDRQDLDEEAPLREPRKFIQRPGPLPRFLGIGVLLFLLQVVVFGCSGDPKAITPGKILPSKAKGVSPIERVVVGDEPEKIVKDLSVSKFGEFTF